MPQIDVQADDTWEINELPSAADRAEWAAAVYVSLRAHSALAQVHGKETRHRVLRALRYLARRGSVTHPITKAVWTKLYELTKMCAYEPDWASASGPLMGASNKTLEDRWNVSNPRRSLRELAGWGFIIPFCPKGNGHRSYKKTALGPIGAGWSLAPLRLLVPALERLVAQEEELRILRLDLPARIKSAIGAIRVLISPFKDAQTWAAEASAELAALCLHRNRTNKGSIEALQFCLDRALDLLERVEKLLVSNLQAGITGGITSTTPDATVQYHYNETIAESVSNGLAGRISGDRAPSSLRSPPIDELHQCLGDVGDGDPFGIVRSGFKWCEAPRLFPFHSGMIDLARGPIAGSVEILARLIGISISTAGYAERRLGRDAAAVCLLMTGQQLADGLIRKNPEAYFRGILRKASSGELNIGHSLFGRRERSELGAVVSH